MPVEKGIGIKAQKAIVEEIATNRWEPWKEARKEKEEIWDECHKHYLVTVDLAKYKNWQWRSKVARPTTQELVDSIIASMMAGLFPDEQDFFKLVPENDIAHKYRGKVAEKFRQVVFTSRFVERCVPFITQLCVIGNSHGQLIWDQSVTERKRWQNGAIRSRQAINWQGPKLEVHDFFNVVFDPRIVEYSQSTPRVIREVKGKAYFKNAKARFSNLDKALKGDAPKESSESARLERRRIYGINEGNLKHTEDDVEVLMHGGDLVVGDTIYRDYIAMVANRKHLIHFEPVKYFCGNPFIFSNYAQMLNELLGRGPAEPIRGLQKLINTFTNQKADIVNLIMGGFWTYVQDGVFDPEQLLMRPFGAVPVADNNTLKSHAPTANPTLGMAEIADLKFEMEQSSGASKMRQGIAAPGRRSATEAIQINAGGANRFNAIVQSIGQTAIEPALNMMLDMFYQFNYGDESILPQEAWDSQFRVRFTGAKDSMLREINIQMFATFTDIITRNDMFAQYINPPAFIKEWMQLLNVRNDELVLNQPMQPQLPQQQPGAPNGRNGTGAPQQQPQPQAAGVRG